MPAQLQHGTQIEMWDTQAIRKFYARYAQKYDSEVEQSKEFYPSPFILGEWCMDHVADDQPRTVLDLGTGTGQSCVPFPSDYKFYGMDATQEMLRRAAERISFKKLLCHDLEAYPYPSLDQDKFDIVVCVGVMDFIRDPLQFLSHVSTFLGKTSVLALTMPEPLPPNEKPDLSSFSQTQMRQLFQDAGLWVERHGRCVGYQDSESGVVRFYHLWLLSLAN